MDTVMPERIWVWYDKTTARQWDPNPVADTEEYVRADTVPPDIHTMIACSRCGRGVRPRNAVSGMCPTCAEAELVLLRAVVGAWQRGPDDVLRNALATYAKWQEANNGKAE